MIAELARQLVDEATEQINHHEAEIARLQLLRESIEAFIAQPGSDRVEAEDMGTSTSPAAGQGAPDPSPPPATEPPGRGQDGDEAQQRGGRPTRRAAPSTSAPSAAASSLSCPKCGRDTFTRKNALAMHVKHCDGIGTQRVRVSAAEVVRIPPPATIHVEDPDEPPRRSERSTIAERIAARDAGRTATHLAGRNPRSTPPLDLPTRADGFPGQ